MEVVKHWTPLLGELAHGIFEDKGKKNDAAASLIAEEGGAEGDELWPAGLKRNKIGQGHPFAVQPYPPPPCPPAATQASFFTSTTNHVCHKPKVESPSLLFFFCLLAIFCWVPGQWVRMKEQHRLYQPLLAPTAADFLAPLALGQVLGCSPSERWQHSLLYPGNQQWAHWSAALSMRSKLSITIATLCLGFVKGCLKTHYPNDKYFAVKQDSFLLLLYSICC